MINTAGKTIFLFITLSSLLFISPVMVQSQPNFPTQNLRGVVLDQILQTPLPGATVTIRSLNRSVVTDDNGSFRFVRVPIGSYQLVISSIGYKEIVLDNITVNTGKETVLNIAAEAGVKLSEAVVVKAGSKKNKPLNDMSMVSARAFTVEETQKYAAAVNDPLRMATGFAGVMSADDGNNNIIIRGNSPTGLLWRMEGVDIPNPNHFSSTGSSGGGISILSAQLLANSDFITGAFASEYGNALSGVFDLKLRKGNNEQREYTLQTGLLGLNAAAEGPLKKGSKGSYLVNYRYSTLELLNKIGVPLEGGATNFQDLSFNVYMPTKKLGTFTWFGFGGRSSQNKKPVKDSTEWKERDDREYYRFATNTGATGITHTILLGATTNLRSALALSSNSISDDYGYVLNNYQLRDDQFSVYRTKKLTLTSTLNHRISAASTLRAGAIFTGIRFSYFLKSRDNESSPLEVQIDEKNGTQKLQGFAQWQYKPAESLTFNAGMHYLQLLYNNSVAVEPRASVKWQANPKNSLAFGYGKHSQLQPLGVYFARLPSTGSVQAQPNKNLGFTKANHYVLSYLHSFQRNLSLKVEAYYQRLYNVPVSVYDSSTLSLLNVESEYITDPLTNQGKGRNYGIEFSLERYLSNAFYYTINTSFYQSKYTALDRKERSTRFNGNYLTNMVAGKEFTSASKLRKYGINIKSVYAGGLRTTPIDLQRSTLEERTILFEKQAYTLQNPAYFRIDLQLSYKWNRSQSTNTVSLDVQNLTNRLNVYGQFYDPQRGGIRTIYQNGLIPVLNYKVEF